MGLKEGSRKAQGQKVLFLSLILRGMLVGAGRGAARSEGGGWSPERESAQLTCLSEEHDPGKLPSPRGPVCAEPRVGKTESHCRASLKSPITFTFRIERDRAHKPQPPPFASPRGLPAPHSCCPTARERPKTPPPELGGVCSCLPSYSLKITSKSTF